MRVASENARLARSEINLGVITDFGGSQRLTHIMGKARALELCLIASPYDARTAHQWGLLAKVDYAFLPKI